jgi:hypothetical protein
MIRLKDVLLGSLLALAVLAPDWVKADPVRVERPHLKPAQFGAALDAFRKS